MSKRRRQGLTWKYKNQQGRRWWFQLKSLKNDINGKLEDWGRRWGGLFFNLGLISWTCKGEKVRRREKAPLGSVSAVQKWRKRWGNVSFSLKLKWFVGPTTLKLQGLKTIIYGSRMRSMKERKMIVKKSSLQKIYFPHDLQISKTMHRVGVKSLFCPFSSKNAISGVRIQMEQT